MPGNAKMQQAFGRKLFSSFSLSSSKNNEMSFLTNRLRHFTWAWFTVPMSTGGIALVLGQLPFQFDGLKTIGLIFYIADAVLFFLVVIAMILRYTLAGASFRYTVTHPTECLFMPTSQLAFATIVMGMGLYAEPHTGPWCIQAMRVCFWIFTAVACIQGPLQYFALFTIESQKSNHTTQNLSPGFILPIFPSMLVGTIANSITKSSQLKQSESLNIAIAGLTFQGLGFLVSCFVYAMLLRRLMQFGLPEPSHRTGLYIAAGPCGFTGLALLGMARNASNFLPEGALSPMFPSSDDLAKLLLVLGLLAALLLWQLAAFWWLLATFSILSAVGKSLLTVQGRRNLRERPREEVHCFSMSWWASIFPISGFCICTIYIGQALDNSRAVGWFATGMAIYLVCAYFTVLAFMIEAVVRGRIMRTGRDEDKPMPRLSRNQTRNRKSGVTSTVNSGTFRDVERSASDETMVDVQQGIVSSSHNEQK